MNDLKLLCKQLGFENVETYIQSGNLIFNSDKPNSELENELEKMIANKFGFDVPIIVRSSEELQTSIEKNPYFNNNVDIDQLHLTFLKDNPTKEKIQDSIYELDKFEIQDKDVFLFCAGKYHQSKLSNNFFEKKLNTKATTRNWKTVLKLSELSKKYE